MISMRLNFENQPANAKWLRALTFLLFALLWTHCGMECVENLFYAERFSLQHMVADIFFASLGTLVLALFYMKLHALAMEQASERISMFKLSPYPMWIYDLETQAFLKVNDAATMLYGFKEEDFMRMKIGDIRADDDVPVLISAADKKKFSQHRQYHWPGTWRHRKKNGEEIYVEISSHEISFDGKKAELVLAYNVTERVLQDQTLQLLNQDLERSVVVRTNDLLHLNRRLVDQNRTIKSANHELITISNQLQEANLKMKEHADLKHRFVAMASHEFRTPMASISFSAGYLRRHLGKLEPKNMVEKLQAIEKHIGHMAAMLDDVLTIGKSDAVKLEVRNTSVSVRDFMTKITEEVRTASNNSHEIVLNIQGDAVQELNTDEKFLRNIFINLFTNAIKYSPGKDRVDVNIYPSDENLCIEVVDGGMGISKQDIEKIFEPFYRVDATQNIQGTGLGLSIVKRAVDLLEGTIEVFSTPGKGSTFKVVLPTRLPATNLVGC